ncbi:MAG TPA: energy-coupling factor transporter transmembrane protein EcfT [Enteractinococcus helveticum]|uniref:Energy-coupling factor transporter transmembrane protein EcfT n=1 Tax=Enteractinococcus helveticum TaxID=1837282 RepID=A0A921FKQ4_9MICC|nr:hypothetical protein [Enteractinococcus helveticum]HJF13893.1 energy-coupling factor transporter transmembrane protein EcfT [Enteractinococcus helveticum]
MTHSPQDPVDLTDPTISPHRLQELAQSHPESWDQILAHPNVYPGLAGWIRDRQAEQSATQSVAAQPQEPTADDDATKVFEPVEAAEEETSTLQPTDDEATGTASDPVQDDAQVDVTETIADHPRSDDPAATDQAQDAAAAQESAQESDQAQQAWAMPDPTAQPHPTDAASSEAEESSEITDAAQQEPASGQAQHGEPIWGWPAATSSSASQDSPSQQQHQAPSGGFSQQSYGYQQQQAPYGYAQQPYGQQPPYGQAFQPRPRPRTPINLNSARTWGLFVTGGAAFMTLFGFFFGPSVGGYGVPMSSHLASGGWMILLLCLATVTLSILQLLKPSAWMRFFFMVVSFGAAFMMIGRTTAVLGFFTLQHTSFSVLWMLFMSLVLLAGVMIYTAPKASDTDQQAQRPGTASAQPAPQQFGYQPPVQQPPYGQQPGTPPYGGYGHQPGGYPSGPQQ